MTTKPTDGSPSAVDAELSRVGDAVAALSDAVRYVAVLVGGRLVTKVAGERPNASGSESDRYEELLVNPTILDLAKRRGDLGCGGLDHVVIRYGSFWQLLIPLRDGHLSVSIEPEADPVELVAPVRAAASVLGAASGDRRSSSVGRQLAPEPFVDGGDAPAWMLRALPSLYGVSDAIRYVAVEADGRLVLSSRVADPARSDDRSDRYEELLVAPTLLTIAEQRGRIDCGGMRFLVVAYPLFYACAFPFLDGHVTFSLPPGGDPIPLAPALEEAVRRASGRAPSDRVAEAEGTA